MPTHTVNANGTVVTSSNIKWNESICCQMFPCESKEKLFKWKGRRKSATVDAVTDTYAACLTAANERMLNERRLPYSQDMLTTSLPIMILKLTLIVLPIVRLVDWRIWLLPNWWSDSPGTPLRSMWPRRGIPFCYPAYNHSYIADRLFGLVTVGVAGVFGHTKKIFECIWRLPSCKCRI